MTSKSTKENSHIIPKFFVKSIFSDGGRAFVIQANKADQRAMIKQSSPTEDFIFCPECEQFFGILEREFANNIYNIISEPAYRELFEDHQVPGQIKVRYCNNINPIVVHLFVQSILWRCSISSQASFTNFKLPDGHEGGLRVSLLNYRTSTLRNFNDLITANAFPLYRGIYNLITYEGEYDETKGNFACFPYNEPHMMPLNKYILVYSFDDNQKQRNFLNMNNLIDNGERAKIGIAEPELWTHFNNMFIKFFADRATAFLKEVGKQPYIIPDSFFLKKPGK